MTEFTGTASRPRKFSSDVQTDEERRRGSSERAMPRRDHPGTVAADVWCAQARVSHRVCDRGQRPHPGGVRDVNECRETFFCALSATKRPGIMSIREDSPSALGKYPGQEKYGQKRKGADGKMWYVGKRGSSGKTWKRVTDKGSRSSRSTTRRSGTSRSRASRSRASSSRSRSTRWSSRYDDAPLVPYYLTHRPLGARAPTDSVPFTARERDATQTNTEGTKSHKTVTAPESGRKIEIYRY